MVSGIGIEWIQINLIYCLYFPCLHFPRKCVRYRIQRGGVFEKTIVWAALGRMSARMSICSRCHVPFEYE